MQHQHGHRLFMTYSLPLHVTLPLHPYANGKLHRGNIVFGDATGRMQLFPHLLSPSHFKPLSGGECSTNNTPSIPLGSKLAGADLHNFWQGGRSEYRTGQCS